MARLALMSFLILALAACYSMAQEAPQDGAADAEVDARHLGGHRHYGYGGYRPYGYNNYNNYGYNNYGYGAYNGYNSYNGYNGYNNYGSGYYNSPYGGYNSYGGYYGSGLGLGYRSGDATASTR